MTPDFLIDPDEDRVIERLQVMKSLGSDSPLNADRVVLCLQKRRRNRFRTRVAATLMMGLLASGGYWWLLYQPNPQGESVIAAVSQTPSSARDSSQGGSDNAAELQRPPTDDRESLKASLQAYRDEIERLRRVRRLQVAQERLERSTADYAAALRAKARGDYFLSLSDPQPK